MGCNPPRPPPPPALTHGNVSISSASATSDRPPTAKSTKSRDSHRNRRRVEDGRVYHCLIEGCGKSFARADHLTRHNLNHEPKRIWYCNDPSCQKAFVRNDLLVRHQERHRRRRTASESTLGDLVSPEHHLIGPPLLSPTDVYPIIPPPSSARASRAVPGLLEFDDAMPAFSSHPPPLQVHSYPDSAPPSAGLVPPAAFSSSSPLASYLPQHFTDPFVGHTDSLSIPNFFEQQAPIPDHLSILGAGGGEPLNSGPYFSAQDASWLFEDFNGTNVAADDQLRSPVAPPPVQPAYGMQTFSKCSPLPAVYQSTILNPLGSNVTITSSDPSVYVSEVTRRRLLIYLAQVPGPLRDLDKDPRFSCHSLQQCLSLYWNRSNMPHFPLLHRATFRVEATQTPLLIAIILIGSYHWSAAIQPLAQQIHRIARGLLICSVDFKPRADLWLIQCSLLTQLFGKMCAERKDHEMAHIFWGALLTLYRRSGLFTQRPYACPETLRFDLEGRWRHWVEAESTRRAAYASFELDTSAGAFFRHTPTLSAFQMQADMPADEDIWSATSALDWEHLMEGAAPPQRFLDALKSTLGRSPPTHLSACARINLLHGLLSVGFDLQWRDQFQAGITSPENHASDWRASHFAVLDCWKRWYDVALETTTGASLALLRGALPIYVLCQIVIGLNLHDLQLYAGARTQLGLAVDPRLVEIAKAKVSGWALTHEGRVAAWHSAHFLRSALPEARSITQPTSLYYSWVLFFSSLTVFAYGSAVSGRVITSRERVESAESYLDQMCTAAPDMIANVACKADCSAILEEIGLNLSLSRWEIAHEAIDILRSLTCDD